MAGETSSTVHFSGCCFQIQVKAAYCILKKYDSLFQVHEIILLRR
jgi:hypothetical protein